MGMFSSSSIKYHRRLFLWLVAYSLVLTGCVVAFQYSRERKFKADELDAQLQIINGSILAELSEGINPDTVRYHLAHPFDELRITVIDSDGEVVYDTSLDTLTHVSHRDREEVAAARRRGQGFSVRRHSETTGVNYFYSARLGADGSVVRTAVPYSTTLSGLLRADVGFLWFMAALTAGMCAIGYFVTRRLGQNISRLSRFAQSAEKGERIYDMEPFPHDELGEISSHIVRLYARLQQTTLERNREHRAALREQMEKERIKKELTNNINHELKTPVASIQLCLETLLSHGGMSAEKRREFLERCMLNTERLRKLLADVALVTRMDDGRSSIVMERLDLSAVIAEACGERRDSARDRGIEIHDEVVAPLPVEGNQSLLLSVFLNLIDNAVAYSGAYDIEVRMVSRERSRVTLLVADNGTGVAEEHLPRLFERFYRIDKGRSRALGGTGLGLSIVRNAISIHGGSISVSNRRTGGLEFRISLPLAADVTKA